MSRECSKIKSGKTFTMLPGIEIFLVPRLAWMPYNWILRIIYKFYIYEMFLKCLTFGLEAVLEKHMSRVRKCCYLSIQTNYAFQICKSNLPVLSLTMLRSLTTIKQLVCIFNWCCALIHHILIDLL